MPRMAQAEEHHRQIGLLLGDALAALDLTDACRLKKLALLRWQLFRRLRTYQLFKHTHLFDPVISKGNGQAAALARAAKGRCEAMADRYVAHLQKWSRLPVGPAAGDYEVDGRAMVAALPEHLRRERADLQALFPELDRIGR